MAASGRVFEELFRRSPSSLPGLKGKVLAATVLPSRPSDKFVDVCAGLKGTVTLLRSELGPGGAAAAPSDVFPVVAEHLETPLGELQLNGERARESERLEGVWREIKAAHATGGLVRVRNPALAALRARRLTHAARARRAAC